LFLYTARIVPDTLLEHFGRPEAVA
jgi:uncharacterized protein YcgL (UPF0745 family)